MAFSDQQRNTAVSVVSIAAGFVASRFLGANLWLTAILAGLAYWAIGRLRPATGMPLRFASALLVAHCIWMLIGVLVLPAQLLQVGPDIVIGFGLAAWILFAPSRASVIVLIVFEVLGCGINLLVLMQAAQGAMVAALVMHMLLRTGIIAACAVALRKGLPPRRTSMPRRSSPSAGRGSAAARRRR